MIDVNNIAKIDSQDKSIKAKIPKASWKLSDIKEFKAATGKPVVVKGIMCLEDAKVATENGADAIWVSNAGGRTLDTLPSTISVLSSIVKAVKAANPKAEVYIDGGIRRGIDVIKCLALGAQMVFLGEPLAWALHYGAKEGVAYMVSILQDEFKTAMILTNSMDVAQITEKQVIHHLSNRARL